jgi:hypothetical protein
MALVWLAIVVVSALLVFADAQKVTEKKQLPIGPGHQSPIAWALGVLLLWLIALPWYLWARGKALAGPDGGDGRVPARRNPLLFALGTLLALVAGIVLLLNSTAFLVAGPKPWAVIGIGVVMMALGLACLRRPSRPG